MIGWHISFDIESWQMVMCQLVAPLFLVVPCSIWPWVDIDRSFSATSAPKPSVAECSEKGTIDVMTCLLQGHMLHGMCKLTPN